MSSSPRKAAVITGGSSGIGFELARRCADEGYDVILVARSLPVLQEKAIAIATEFGVTATPIAFDLAKSASAQALYDAVRALGATVEILINNAGFGTHGFFADTRLEEELEELQLNIITPTVLSKLFLRDMVQRRSGRVMNVSSTAGFQPGPLMAVYYASKAYLLSFSEAVATELRGTGVTMTVLCPGPTMTDFARRGGMATIRLF